MNIFKSEKFQKIFYPIFYFVFTVAVTISGCFIFQRYYYTNIFVSGSSMLPTLVGYDNNYSNPKINCHHYGIADTSSSAIDGLKRFDVVIAKYPFSWSSGTAGLVVKRVWGLPGEHLVLASTSETSTFTVYKGEKEIYSITAEIIHKDVNKIYSVETSVALYEFNTDRRQFYTYASEHRSFDYTLGNNEYFVMGDHWGDSTDSYSNYSKTEKFTREFVKGKVICIQGYGSVKKADDGSYTIYDKHPITPKYIF